MWGDTDRVNYLREGVEGVERDTLREGVAGVEDERLSEREGEEGATDARAALRSLELSSFDCS